MEFKVIAKTLGYYKHVRRKEGSVFMMDEKDMIKKEEVSDVKLLAEKVIVKSENGEFVLPKWVKLAKSQVPDVTKKQKQKKEVDPSEEETIEEDNVI